MVIDNLVSSIRDIVKKVAVPVVAGYSALVIGSGCINIDADGNEGGNGESGGNSSNLDDRLFGFWYGGSGESLFFNSEGIMYDGIEDDCDFENKWQYSTRDTIITLRFREGGNADDLTGQERTGEYSINGNELFLNFFDYQLNLQKDTSCSESSLRPEY